MECTTNYSGINVLNLLGKIWTTIASRTIKKTNLNIKVSTNCLYLTTCKDDRRA